MPPPVQQYQVPVQQQQNAPYMVPQMAFEPGSEPLLAQTPFGHVVTSGLPAVPMAREDGHIPLDRPSAGSTVRVWCPVPGGPHHSCKPSYARRGSVPACGVEKTVASWQGGRGTFGMS